MLRKFNNTISFIYPKILFGLFFNKCITIKLEGGESVCIFLYIFPFHFFIFFFKYHGNCQ